MNTFALLTTSDHLQSSDPDVLGGYESMSSRTSLHSLPQSVLASASEGASQLLSQAVGIRLARRTVARWYHGGINE